MSHQSDEEIIVTSVSAAKAAGGSFVREIARAHREGRSPELVIPAAGSHVDLELVVKVTIAALTFLAAVAQLIKSEIDRRKADAEKRGDKDVLKTKDVVEQVAKLAEELETQDIKAISSAERRLIITKIVEREITIVVRTDE